MLVSVQITTNTGTVIRKYGVIDAEESQTIFQLYNRICTGCITSGDNFILDAQYRDCPIVAHVTDKFNDVMCILNDARLLINVCSHYSQYMLFSLFDVLLNLRHMNCTLSQIQT